MSIVPRRSYERHGGGGDYGWLKAFHTFNVGAFSDGKHDNFGCLRVMNEDRVEPETGFDLHPHREFEILSYIISGQLLHEDSMGNREILQRCDIQLTSAGTGIRHSEKSHGSQQVHYFQIWSIPSKSGLTPRYYTRHFEEEDKRDKWCLVVAPANTLDVTDTQAHLHLYIRPSRSMQQSSLRASLSHTRFRAAGAAIHDARGAHIEVSLNSATEVLWEGDGAYIIGEQGEKLVVQNVGDLAVEVLLFDVE
ncbi:hypothetical protein EVJ58_g491 [Rhodofomes roseus]|uniref:Pirin N-terminal domain-containing protein n=1 Tax=Rhodofomes roseus TaxID=34475 RepID=A0A4Y9Z608_9APHY|nr:hypothetical protein EVJ58_g491 [Rhodofomes roseus]